MLAAVEKPIALILDPRRRIMSQLFEANILSASQAGSEPRDHREIPTGRRSLDGVSFGIMARPATTPILRRKRGNPNWGRPMPPAPVLATEFERQVRTLRLTPETYVFSAELRRWCWQNRNRFYIPEWLLEKWRIAVDPYTSNAA
jgi:hypothetical protein